MRRLSLIASFLTVGVFQLLSQPSFAQQFNFASIDVQCAPSAASCPAGIAPGESAAATWATGISPGGQIVGGYIGADDGLEHGYVYSGGKFTTIDVPGLLAGLSADMKLETEVNGINAIGEMVGDYFAPPGAPDAPACVIAYSPPCDRGFLYSHGQFYNVLASGHLGSVPNSITPTGTVYGCVHDQDFGPSMHGFADSGSGAFTLLSFSPSMSNGATPGGDIMVGLYVPPGSHRPHGFVIRDGALSDYLFPGSVATQAWGINPGGDFVGFYRNAPGPTGVHGFLQPGDGSAPMSIDFVDPNTQAHALLTQAFGINPGGSIVGVYLDNDGGEHGYAAGPAVSTLSLPGGRPDAPHSVVLWRGGVVRAPSN